MNIYDYIIIIGLVLFFIITYFILLHSVRKKYKKFKLTNVRICYSYLLVRKNLVNLKVKGRNRLTNFYIADMIYDTFLLLGMNQIVYRFSYLVKGSHELTYLATIRAVCAILEDEMMLLVVNLFPKKNKPLIWLANLFTIIKHLSFIGYLLLAALTIYKSI